MLAESADLTIYQAGRQGPQCRGPQPLSFHGAGTRILQHDVGATSQFEGLFPVDSLAQVQHNRTLAAVISGKHRAVGVARPANSACRVAAWRFHLDHFSAEVCQRLGGGWRSNELAELDDSQALQRGVGIEIVC